jgi:hypothetical protein
MLVYMYTTPRVYPTLVYMYTTPKLLHWYVRLLLLRRPQGPLREVPSGQDYSTLVYMYTTSRLFDIGICVYYPQGGPSGFEITQHWYICTLLRDYSTLVYMYTTPRLLNTGIMYTTPRSFDIGIYVYYLKITHIGIYVYSPQGGPYHEVRRRCASRRDTRLLNISIYIYILPQGCLLNTGIYVYYPQGGPYHEVDRFATRRDAR